MDKPTSDLIATSVYFMVKAIGDGNPWPEQWLLKYSDETGDTDWEGLSERIRSQLTKPKDAIDGIMNAFADPDSEKQIRFERADLMREVDYWKDLANGADQLAQDGWRKVEKLREALEMVRDSAAWHGVGLTEDEKDTITKALVPFDPVWMMSASGG